MRLEDREALVTVFSTKDPVVVAVAKSILDGAGIQYLAWGDTANALFGGTLVGFNPSASLVKIQVRESLARDARELLRELSEPGADQATELR